MYARTSDGHAGVETISDEPVVLLLTPLHPLRLAWHVHAQSLLSESLVDRCPLAGLLSPNQTPSITALPIWFGQQFDWRPFVTVSTDDKHWTVLVNDTYLRDPLREETFAVLRRLGLTPQGVTGGMSVQQAKRALADVGGILSAKPVLRIGVVGSPQEEAGSVDGLLQWVDEGFRPPDPPAAEDVQPEEAEELRLPVAINPVAVEVFDFREDSLRPSQVKLANLSEDLGGRLRWFDGTKSGNPAIDVVMFDQR